MSKKNEYVVVNARTGNYIKNGVEYCVFVAKNKKAVKDYCFKNLNIKDCRKSDLIVINAKK